MSTRNHKFRLYPTIEQAKKLQENLDVCRWVYNKFVESAQNRIVSRNDLNYFLTELKQSEPWLYKYHAKMLQMVSTQLAGAQNALNEMRKKGRKCNPPQFATYNKYRSFIYNQFGYELTRHGNTDLLYLSKIGFIEIRKHRMLLENTNVKQVIISKSKTGKWFACITCDVNNTVLPRIDFKKVVGIDVGIHHFAFDSKAHSVPNPLNLMKMLKPLKRIQKKIDRRQKGSQNRRKALRHYQIIHERITNRRRDFLHKLSTCYGKNNDVVFVERLAKLNMVKNHTLAGRIIDSAWGTFCNMLDYKCKMLVEVSPRNTTIDCSRCGNAVPKSLAVRIHKCDKCGLILDRDINAAFNILKKGLDIFGITFQLPQELREVTPMEIRSSVVEAGKIYEGLFVEVHKPLTTNIRN